MEKWNRLMSWLPAILLFGILAFIYSIFYMSNISKKIQEGLNIEFVIVHLAILIFLIALFRSMTIEPGIISQEIIEETWKQWDEYQKQEKERISEQKQRRSQKSAKTFKTEQDEDKSVVNMDEDSINEEDDYHHQQETKTKEKRFCRRCCKPKPLRTHHCSQCQCCWQRMDHHCQWINNCVAKDNYKVFICMIFYASLLLVYVSISQYKEFLQVIESDVEDITLFLIVLHYYFVLLLTVIINGFFIFHIYLISQNRTTLEQLENKPDCNNYDKGFVQNIKEMLGSNFFYWFLPLKI